MYDFTQFSASDMMKCRTEIRALADGAGSMEQVAGRIVSYLYDDLRDGRNGPPGCALVRFFKTHAYGELEPELQAFAGSMLGTATRSPRMKCLVLLGTRGQRPEWDNRKGSHGHQAIPLPSEEMVQQAPMISRLIEQLGLTIGAVLTHDRAFLVDSREKRFNVFHVLDAVGSPYIPAQKEFVVPYGIQSVLGFGGLLPLGDLFATILFSKVPISKATAELFSPLALSAKLAILRFDGRAVFSDQAPAATY